MVRLDPRLVMPVALAAFAVATAFAFTAPVRADEPEVGDKAPAFELKGSDGETYSLEQFEGETPVVIAWFPKAFTGGCTAECKSMRDNSEALKGTGVAYFTASCDTVEDNTKFAESLEVDYPILSDPDGDIARAYGVIDDGRPFPRRWTFYIGKDGVIKAIDKNVQTGTAGQDIVAKLKELGLTGE